MRQLLTWLLFWAGLLLASALLISSLEHPFRIVFALWIAALILSAIKTSNVNRKALCINIIAVLSVLFWLENHQLRKISERTTRFAGVEDLATAEMNADDIDRKLQASAPLIGYKNSANYVGDHERKFDDTLGFKVRYTTDSNGNRSGWPVSQEPPNECTVVFGCSYTFGFGLNDDEPVAYQLGRLTGSHVVNLGVNSYGPHQLLAMLEFGLFDGTANCKPATIIYQAIPDHLRRAGGYTQYGDDRTAYDVNGPRYILSDDGELEYTGLFRDFTEGQAKQSVQDEIFGKSSIYQEYFVNRDWLGTDDVDLYIAIVADIRRRLKERYPDVEFVVVYWDTTDRDYADEIGERLPRIADTYIQVSDIISDINDNRGDYFLLRDNHPNARANLAVAIALAGLITPDERPALYEIPEYDADGWRID